MIKVQLPHDANAEHESVQASVEEPTAIGPGLGWEAGRSRERVGTSVTAHTALVGLAARSHSRVRKRSVREGPVEVMQRALDFLILNGLLVTPLVSVGGFVGLILPPDHALHQIAPALICTATVWFFLAVAYSHVWHDRHQRAPSRYHPQNTRVGSSKKEPGKTG